MNDILPADAPRWQHLEHTFRETAEHYGFGEVRTPLLEPTALFSHQIGETTDVVEKEMYSFERHGDQLTVRPEGTASVARAYVEHKVMNLEPVSRMYYVGPMFRGERPAKGRYRQFHQAGCEIFGDGSPVCDAELIELAVGLLAKLGIDDIVVHINSLGSGDTRARYREALQKFFEPKLETLSDDSKRRFEKNPLRILDSKSAKDREASIGAPTILELLTDDDRAHFDAVKAQLDALEVRYVVDEALVRGLDYYTRTLFELRTSKGDLGSQNTLCGGGRYDGMVESLGGPSVPAIGFAMGLERILLSMPESAPARVIDCTIAIQTVDARGPGLRLARQLRDLGVRTEVDGRDVRLKAMLKRADARKSRFAILIGEGEVSRQAVALKDLDGDAQDEVPIGEVARLVADRVRGTR